MGKFGKRLNTHIEKTCNKMNKRHPKFLLIVPISLLLVACDNKVDSCLEAQGGFDYELKECRCYSDNASKVCDVYVERPATEEASE